MQIRQFTIILHLIKKQFPTIQTISRTLLIYKIYEIQRSWFKHSLELIFPSFIFQDKKYNFIRYLSIYCIDSIHTVLFYIKTWPTFSAHYVRNCVQLFPRTVIHDIIWSILSEYSIRICTYLTIWIVLSWNLITWNDLLLCVVNKIFFGKNIFLDSFHYLISCH